MRILAVEKVAPEGLALLRRRHEVDEFAGLSRDELLARIADYDALLVRSATKVTGAVIERAKRLRVIARAGVGVDNVDVAAATRRGILVVNTPAGSTVAAAEHTVGLILSLLKRIPQADRSMKSGKWDRKAFVGRELRGATVGVIGLGRIGSEVARLILAMQARVLAYDPAVRPEIGRRKGVEMTDLHALLSASDIVTLHVPLTDDTQHLIRKETIALMRQGAYLVNCARGEIVRTADLLEALQTGKLAGAALDVFESEPPSADAQKLTRLENVIATPHIAASTEEAQRNIGVLLAEQVLAGLEGKLVADAVNLPALPTDLLGKMGIFLGLVYALAQVMAKLSRSPIERIEVGFSQEVPPECHTYLARLAVAGVLAPLFEKGTVNAVNAMELAEERAIEVEHGRADTWRGRQNLLRLAVVGAGRRHSITGCASDDTGTRILALDDFVLDLRPVGNMLLTLHKDQPGVVAHVTTELAEREINISEMHVARHDAGGTAMMLVGVDCALASDIVEAIQGTEGIERALCLTFPSPA
ncbi:MAG: phosphoglycerate dehydrogenase [Planctomycetota bacterium]